MNRRLATQEFFADEPSIADFSILGWAWRHPRHKVDLAEFPHVRRWYETMMARPGVAARIRGEAGVDSSILRLAPRALPFGECALWPRQRAISAIKACRTEFRSSRIVVRCRDRVALRSIGIFPCLSREPVPRSTAADLAGRAAVADLDLQLHDFRNVAVCEPRAGLVHEERIGRCGAEGRIAGKADFDAEMAALLVLAAHVLAAHVGRYRRNDGRIRQQQRTRGRTEGVREAVGLRWRWRGKQCLHRRKMQRTRRCRLRERRYSRSGIPLGTRRTRSGRAHCTSGRPVTGSTISGSLRLQGAVMYPAYGAFWDVKPLLVLGHLDSR